MFDLTSVFTSPTYGFSHLLQRLCVFVTALALLTILRSEDSRAQSILSDRIIFEVDYCRFRTSSDLVYLEMYYSVPRNQLEYFPEKDRYRADFRIESKLFQNDSLVVKDVLNNVTYTDSLSQVTPNQGLISISNFGIRDGEYQMVVRISDLNSDRFGILESDLKIKPISKRNLTISDIQLASNISSKTENPDKFTKNTYRVIPNPSGIYSLEMPMLYFYAEIYNLIQNGESNQYRVKSSLLNSDEVEIRTMQERVKDKPGTSSVEVTGFNIISLKSGRYFVRLEVEDLASNERATRSKKFYVYRAGDPLQERVAQDHQVSTVDALNSPEYELYNRLDEEAIDNEFLGATYIASKENKKIFKNLDLQGKRDFMKSFWLARDSDRTTLQNEFRQDYLRRLRFVNARFGTNKAGWKRDRGRVILLYGQPDEVERFPSGLQARSYVIWRYFEVQGGVEFVFVDIRGFGEYRLVHSTALNELQDFEWRRRWLSGQDSIIDQN